LKEKKDTKARRDAMARKSPIISKTHGKRWENNGGVREMEGEGEYKEWEDKG
jgi:hypothetical protein